MPKPAVCPDRPPSSPPPLMDATAVRAMIRDRGWYATVRYLAKRNIGSPSWFISIAGDLLPRKPSTDKWLRGAQWTIEERAWFGKVRPISLDPYLAAARDALSSPSTTPPVDA